MVVILVVVVCVNAGGVRSSEVREGKREGFATGAGGRGPYNCRR